MTVFMFKWSGGAVLALLAAAAVLAALALRWLGRNGAAISAGIGVAFKVLAVLAVTGGAGALIYRARKRAGLPAAPEPGTRHAAPEQVPLPQAAEPEALPPGGTHSHLHFYGMSAEDAAGVIRQAGGDDQ